MNRTIFRALTLVALLAIGATAQAQRTAPRRSKTAVRRALPNERTQGFMLGVHTIAAPGVKLTSAEYEPGYSSGFGLGAGVMAGYGFNRIFSSFVSFDVARQGAHGDISGTFGLGHLEIGLRANLPNVSLGSPNTLPYLVGSFGRRALGARVTDLETDESGDIAFHGGMLGLGAGFEHFISPNMSFDAGVHLGFGTFDRLTVDGEDFDFGANETTSMRLRFGVTWRP